MSYFIIMWVLAAVVSAFFLYLHTADYMNCRSRIEAGPSSVYHTMARYKNAKTNIVTSRRYMRLSFACLLLSFAAGILVPVAAVAAAGYGAWRLMYMLFFEKVEASE